MPRCSGPRVFFCCVFALAIQAVDAGDGGPVRDEWRDELDAMVRSPRPPRPLCLIVRIASSLGLTM